MARSEWTQIRCENRREGIRPGMQARLADPLWMLARQWQFGGFQGDDAASPAKVEVHHSRIDVHHLVPSGGKSTGPQARSLGEGTLIEAAVEAEPPKSMPSFSRMSGEAGIQLLRMLPKNARGKVLAKLQEEFPLRVDKAGPGAASGGNRRILTALKKGSFDGHALATKIGGDGAKLDAYLEGEVGRIKAIGAAWLTYLQDRFEPQDGKGHWQQQALEYRFDLLAGHRGADEVRLAAKDYGGDGLDWQEFDITTDSVKRPGRAQREWLLPNKLAYSGMPADRFWDFEDGQVWFGGMTMEETSLAQMILAEFATVYSNDWFIVPITSQRGSLLRIEKLRVHDSFGEVTDVMPCAVNDGADRVWRWFELTGDRSPEQELSPWLFLPRAAAGGDGGPAVERVYFTRDESANLAWGIEELVEGAAGYPVDRRQHWNRVRDNYEIYIGRNRSEEPAEQGSEPVSAKHISAASEAERAWQYRLVTPVPPHWVPFQPETDDKRTTGLLRRARLREWDLLGDAKEDLAGPQGKVMDPSMSMNVSVEEILRGGVAVERAWQSARGPDGSLSLWASRRKLPGAGDRPSGRRTDAIDKGEGK